MPTKRQNDARGAGKWQGMNWITQVRRLAIYLRDGAACVYCGEGLEHGATLSLDHVKPHSKGGTNHETNLVTCCKRCNDSRGNRPLTTFAKGVAAYRNHGLTADVILRDVKKPDPPPACAVHRASQRTYRLARFSRQSIAEPRQQPIKNQ